MTSRTKPVTYRLNVHQAVDLLCQTGDLRHQQRAVATAQQGQEVHRRIQAAWPASIDREVSLKWRFEQAGFNVALGGRIDGLQQQQDYIRYLEIKTLRHAPELLPAGLRMRHRLQVLLYAHVWQLHNPQATVGQVELCLVYVDTSQQKTTEQAEHCTAAELTALTTPLINSLLAWFDQLYQHRKARNQILEQISFPFLAFRDGQRQLATDVFRTLRDRRQALIEAPTGSGKSAATLFPALKAMAAGHLDQIIITTAKNATQQAALETINLLQLDNPSLRTLQLTAKEKLCPQDSICTWQDCPRQSGFFERLGPARQECLGQGYLPTARLREIALCHDLCPHGLQSYLQPWFDLLIGDYNYVFSPIVRADLVFSFNHTVLLIDEAHNLPDRARDLFSAQLNPADFNYLLSTLNSGSRPLAKATRRLLSELKKFDPQTSTAHSSAALKDKLEQFLNCAEQWMLSPQDLFIQSDQPVMNATESCTRQVRQWLLISATMDNDFVCFEEKYTATTTDDHPETINQEPPRQQPVKTKKQPSQPGLTRRLHLRCLSPARMLKPYFAASRASVLFSATLTPPGFFQQLLGLEDNLTKNRLPSPFGEQGLKVLVAPFINMRSKARISSLAAITELVATTFRAWPGNYWVYTPSFEYLHRLSAIFAETCPDIELVCQRQGALEDQADFLQHFTQSSKIIGFTVLGSVFGEGIDMPGDRLIGAIILGPGLPRISLINDSISACFQQQALDGFAYAYQLPGWQKVVQAAGRVIRTETDRGVVILADDRFTQNSYRALMPPHWHPIVCRNNDDLQTHLNTFWSRQMG